MFKKIFSFILTTGALLSSFSHAGTWLSSSHKGLASPPTRSSKSEMTEAKKWKGSFAFGYGLEKATINSQISSSSFSFSNNIGQVNLDFNGPKATIIPSFGYGNIFELRLKGSGSLTYSSQIMGIVAVRQPTQGYMFSGEGTLFFGIPCGRGFTLMPAAGWGIEQVYAKSRPNQAYKISFMQRFFIPHAGLFFQIAPEGSIYMRAGISALLPTGRIKLKDTNEGSAIVIPYQKLKASRAGIKGEIEIRYRLGKAARAFLIADYKSYSVRGSVDADAILRGPTKTFIEDFSMCIGLRFGF